MATTVPQFISSSPQKTVKHKPTTSPVGEGMLVTMYSLKGITAADVLKTPFYFQCPPIDDVTRSYAYDWQTYNTLRRGEMMQAAGRRLATISFGTLFVDQTYSWTFQRKYGSVPDPQNNLNYPNPQKMARELVQIMHSGTPFGLSVTHPKLWKRADIHWATKHGNAAVLQSVDVSERAGELDTRYVNVSFQEYRDPKIRRRAQEGQGRDESRGRDLPVTVVVHKDSTAGVRDGERDGDEGKTFKDVTLRKLAKFYYGEQSLWRDLAKANGIKNFSGDRPLGEYVKRRKEKQIKVKVPKMRAVWKATGEVDFPDLDLED